MQAIDRIRDTARSHDRIFLVEVMGGTRATWPPQSAWRPARGDAGARGRHEHGGRHRRPPACAGAGETVLHRRRGRGVGTGRPGRWRATSFAAPAMTSVWRFSGTSSVAARPPRSIAHRRRSLARARWMRCPRANAPCWWRPVPAASSPLIWPPRGRRRLPCDLTSFALSRRLAGVATGRGRRAARRSRPTRLLPAAFTA